MQWTERQKSVIDTKEKNMLISAAAGSGKTAVLVEKIKRLIIDGGVDVSELLVVTFTRAAAAEMKEKIIRAIGAAAESDPENAGRLRRQLEGMSRAAISTFDSFAKDVVEKYFYIIGIEPGLRISDEQESAILKAEAMDETFGMIYEEADPEMMRFMDAYQSPKSDKAMKKELIDLYDKLRKMPEGIGWLRDALGRDPEYLRDVFFRSVMEDLKEARSYFTKAADILEDEGLENAAAKAKTDEAYVTGLLRSEESSIISGIAGFKAVQMRYTKDEGAAADESGAKGRVSSLRERGKDIMTALKERTGDIDERLDEVRRTLPYQAAVLGALEKYESVYSAMKLERGVMDFDDASHFALAILGSEDVAGEYRERFRYIFIDEYQDSNYMQEALISKVRRDDNVFMVGDIKQSIYGFRNAEPDIFRKRSEAYASDDDESSVKIDLNSNFRSKQEIIDSVNDIFADLMEGYDEDAALVLGDPYAGPISYPTELHIVDMKPDEDAAPADEAKAEKQRTEAEAELVADIVASSIGLPIFDSQAGEERKLEKRDIVILLRAAKNRAEKYYEALTDRGIDAYIDDNSGYFETVEIRTMIDMLKVIDNRYRDIPLLSVLKSGLFDFSNEDLIRIRMTGDGLFSEAFFGYPEAEGAESALSEKVAAFTKELDRMADLAAYTPVDELVWKLMDESGYYAFAGNLPAGGQRMANLRSLVDKAGELAGRSDGTLREFIGYVDKIDRRELNANQRSLKNEKDDIVRIMTIHKSKGLEFPMVIVAGLAGKLKGGGRNAAPKCGILHKDVGFAMPLIDREKMYSKDTVAMDLVKRKQAADELEEAKRVFYVACTRAKDRLVLVGTSDNWEKAKDAYDDGVVMTGSYLDMVLSSAKSGTIRRIIHSAGEMDSMTVLSRAGAARERSRRLAGLFDPEDGEGREDIRREIERRLTFTYPYEDSLEKKSKYSVSELNRESHRAGADAYDLEPPKRTQLGAPSFAEEKSGEAAAPKITGMQYGTAMHAVMEQLDFAEAGRLAAEKDASGLEKLIEEKAEWMRQAGLLLPEEADAVSVKQIAGFFATDTGKRAAAAAAAGKLSKEKHFTIKHRMEGASEEVLVQGIIDCFFEREDGGLVLIDYKTNLKTEGIEELYREQMALYREALEKATGKDVAESYLYLFTKGEFADMEAGE